MGLGPCRNKIPRMEFVGFCISRSIFDAGSSRFAMNTIFVITQIPDDVRNNTTPIAMLRQHYNYNILHKFLKQNNIY